MGSKFLNTAFAGYGGYNSYTLKSKIPSDHGTVYGKMMILYLITPAPIWHMHCSNYTFTHTHTHTNVYTHMQCTYIHACVLHTDTQVVPITYTHMYCTHTCTAHTHIHIHIHAQESGLVTFFTCHICNCYGDTTFWGRQTLSVAQIAPPVTQNLLIEFISYVQCLIGQECRTFVSWICELSATDDLYMWQ